jgi:carbonic anhydrase
MIDELKRRNIAWAEGKTRVDPEFFNRLVSQQSPEYLWIGCADSRVPANEIVGMEPGELFVHRNVANLASPQDLNYLAVLQYSVEVLKVRHILVVGHYGCGGVKAALEYPDHGLVDNWIAPIRMLADEFKAELAALPDEHARHDRLVELNALRQAKLVAETPIVLKAREANDGYPKVHAWCYSLKTGLLKDLNAPAPAPIEPKRRKKVLGVF